MKKKKFDKRTALIGFLFLFSVFLNLESEPIKIRIIVDNASVKATPEIGGKTLAKIPLDIVLESEEKQGEWYKVTIEAEGIKITGYIHQMLVEIYTGEETLSKEFEAEKEAGISQAEFIAGIEIRLEDSKRLVRQEKDFEKTINDLRPLIAKAFRITDDNRQKKIASEIYLWLGLAFAGMNDGYYALIEFRNMFEVDDVNAREITRNIYDPEVIRFIEHAEKQYRGLITDYSLEISTTPKEATIKIDGKEVGISPEVYRTIVPKFTLEIEKEGYELIKQEVFLSEASSKMEFTLESLGRTLEVRSNPQGARVYLDGEDTEQITDCQLPFVAFGVHKINLIKENYAEWEDSIEIKEGQGPVSVDFILTVKNYGYLKKWGGPESKYFQRPTAITVDKEDNFYVLDTSDAKVKKFDPQGKYLSSYGNRGKDLKKLKAPAGIAIDNQGFLYITDSKNHSISKFSKEGMFVKKWGKEGNKEVEFKNPTGIAVDGNNDIYVVDSGNSRVKKFSSDGVLKKIWGKRGTSDGDFISPAAVAVNQKNEVFVVDRVRIQKFTSEGEFIASWGKTGTNDGELNRPKGLFIDQHNYIYVADSGNNRIQKFDENGRFISKWGSAGVEDGQMTFPQGIAVNSSGYVFIAERDNNRVQQFGVLTE